MPSSASARRSCSSSRRRPTPILVSKFLQSGDEALIKRCGLSRQKRAYVLDLAMHFVDGEIPTWRFARMTDDEVIQSLIQVKGIGVWTAQMFLIFSLGRLDVFPHDDLGVRVAIRNLYSLQDLPDKETSHRIATPWRPYASVASWYCWRSLEFKDAQ